jgi:hypothetical protein
MEQLLRCSLSCIPTLQSLQMSESTILNLFRCLPRRSCPVFNLNLATSAFLLWAVSLFLLIMFSQSFSLESVFHLFLNRDLTAALICALDEWNDIPLNGCFLYEPKFARQSAFSFPHSPQWDRTHWSITFTPFASRDFISNLAKITFLS